MATCTPVTIKYSPSTSAGTVFTVPAGERYVVRQIHIYNQGGFVQRVAISHGTIAAGLNIISQQVQEPTGPPLQIWGRFVFNATELMQAVASSGSGMVMFINYDRYVL